MQIKYFYLLSLVIANCAGILAGPAEGNAGSKQKIAGDRSPAARAKAAQTGAGPQIRILQPGADKADPYTILIVNNPSLMKKKWTGKYGTERDPINGDLKRFNESADYIYANLFGRLAGQAERFLADDSIRDQIRVISVWKNDLAAIDANSLIDVRKQFEGRQEVVVKFIDELRKTFPGEKINADVVFAVTGESNRNGKLQPSAFWSVDDVKKGGIPFTFDGKEYLHCYYSLIPGLVAIHADDRSMKPLHEFSHAASSLPNGYVSDLYNNDDNNLSTLIVNKKIDARYQNDVPPVFGVYNDVTYAADTYRDPNARQTIHAARRNAQFPALMDNYNKTPFQSEHDTLTRQFLLDRIRAKTVR